MKTGIEIAENYFDLWGCYSKDVFSCYSENGCRNVCKRVVLAIPSAIAKTFLFPLACLIGLVVFPIIALASCFCPSLKFNDGYMTVTVVCLLGVGVIFGFATATAFCERFTIKYALNTLASAFSISIGYHVWKAVAPRP